jgi:hypothetical protein
MLPELSRDMGSSHLNGKVGQDDIEKPGVLRRRAQLGNEEGQDTRGREREEEERGEGGKGTQFGPRVPRLDLILLSGLGPSINKWVNERRIGQCRIPTPRINYGVVRAGLVAMLTLRWFSRTTNDEEINNMEE